jgi:membrane-bound serine protease (ClpP class)
MAPATNLGAATPVAIGIGGQPPGGDKPADKDKTADKDKDATPAGDALTRKQVHDATAYIRGLAELRGRNAEWAERAVREAVSLSAEQALEMKVIDLIADDVGDLLDKLDGARSRPWNAASPSTLKGAEIERHAPDWRSRLLAVITDPGIAYILLLIGVYGLFFEVRQPRLPACPA